MPVDLGKPIMQPRLETLADGVELWLGDSREVISLVGAVDHVLMDPPYEEHMHAAKRRQKLRRSQRKIRSDGYRDPEPLNFGSIEKLRPVIVDPLVVSCAGWFIAFCTPEGIAPWRDAIEAAGARYKRACFWEKPDAAPQFNGQGPAFGVEPFVTAWCGSGVSRWNGGGRRNLFTHATNQPDRDGLHPTEKPLPLLAELVTLFTDPDQRIFDPFMGSGTTGMAAVRCGRRFVGIESNLEYFDLARRRIGSVVAQADMFIHIPKPQKPVKML